LRSVRTFSTNSRPCGRPPPAAVLGRQRDDGNRERSISFR
jgi:hypothetical protein